MLQFSYIENHIEEVVLGLRKRGLDVQKQVDEVLALNQSRKELQFNQDELLAKKNTLSKEIGLLYKQGHIDEANVKKEEVKQLNESIEQLENKLQDTKQQLHAELVQLPNVPHMSVPAGTSEEDNEEVDKVGDFPHLDPSALPHWELAEKYNIIDFETGVKLTGAGFPVYKGKGAQLQRALINFFLSEASKAGYTEIQPPYMVNEDSGFGTGQLPDKEGQMYGLIDNPYFLIPTAEVPLTNIYRDTIIDQNELPIKLTAYSPCFRREAGSYGKDVRGLNRLHQFDKVEIVQFVQPEQSYQILEEMKAHIASLLQKLELPYRVLRLCGGDLGFTSALTFDFETYSAAQQRWLEVSSVSNFETFQTNRMKIRYRPNQTDSSKAKTQLLHTLNGSALALPRIVATLLENNQTPNGIKIPEALQPFTGFNLIS